MSTEQLENTIINTLAKHGELTTKQLEILFGDEIDDVGETCWNMAHSGLLDINWTNNKFRLVTFKGGLS
jgi:hypothetical protein